METVTPDESRLDEEQEPAAPEESAAPEEATPPGEAPPTPSQGAPEE